MARKPIKDCTPEEAERRREWNRAYYAAHLERHT
jgi:hypothetical protein